MAEIEFESNVSNFSALMIGIGGLIGGGIFSVLGVVIQMVGPLAWLTYLFTGATSLFTVYADEVEFIEYSVLYSLKIDLLLGRYAKIRFNFLNDLIKPVLIYQINFV